MFLIASRCVRGFCSVLNPVSFFFLSRHLSRSMLFVVNSSFFRAREKTTNSLSFAYRRRRWSQRDVPLQLRVWYVHDPLPSRIPTPSSPRAPFHATNRRCRCDQVWEPKMKDSLVSFALSARVLQGIPSNTNHWFGNSFMWNLFAFPRRSDGREVFIELRWSESIRFLFTDLTSTE